MYDAYLLMPTDPSYLDARDAYLAADRIRFGGANQSELWLGFAQRGMGYLAFSTNDSTADTDWIRSPTSPRLATAESTVTFKRGRFERRQAIRATIFVGHYEARVSPIADTNPSTSAGGPRSANNLDARAAFVPGRYEFVAKASGHGTVRFRKTLAAGTARTVTVTDADEPRVALPRRYGHRRRRASLRPDRRHRGDELAVDRHPRPREAGHRRSRRRCPADQPRAGERACSCPARTASRRSASSRSGRATTRPRRAAARSRPTSSSAIETDGHAFPGTTPRPRSSDMLTRSFALPGTYSATHVRIVVADEPVHRQP